MTPCRIGGRPAVPRPRDLRPQLLFILACSDEHFAPHHPLEQQLAQSEHRQVHDQILA
jgi:hypothetical protein